MKSKLYSLLQATIIIIGTVALCSWFNALPFILSLLITFTITQITTSIIEHFIKVYKIKRNNLAITAKTLIKNTAQNGYAVDDTIDLSGGQSLTEEMEVPLIMCSKK